MKKNAPHPPGFSHENEYNDEILGKITAKEEMPLQVSKEAAQSKNALARQVWLNYYNDYLKKHGIISEEMWRKMRLVISRD